MKIRHSACGERTRKNEFSRPVDTGVSKVTLIVLKGRDSLVNVCACFWKEDNIDPPRRDWRLSLVWEASSFDLLIY